MASRTVVRRAAGGVCRHPDFGILTTSHCGVRCTSVITGGARALELEVAGVTACPGVSGGDPNRTIITTAPGQSVFLSGEYLCNFVHDDLDPDYQLVNWAQVGLRAAVSFY